MSGALEGGRSHGVREYISAEIGSILEYLSVAVQMFVVLNLGIGWALFWAAAARIHYIQGQVLEAGLLVATVLLPGVIATLVYLRGRLASPRES